MWLRGQWLWDIVKPGITWVNGWLAQNEVIQVMQEKSEPGAGIPHTNANPINTNKIPWNLSQPGLPKWVYQHFSWACRANSLAVTQHLVNHGVQQCKQARLILNTLTELATKEGDTDLTQQPCLLSHSRCFPECESAGLDGSIQLRFNSTK